MIYCDYSTRFGLRAVDETGNLGSSLPLQQYNKGVFQAGKMVNGGSTADRGQLRPTLDIETIGTTHKQRETKHLRGDG
jgi:hypothetical protein